MQIHEETLSTQLDKPAVLYKQCRCLIITQEGGTTFTDKLIFGIISEFTDYLLVSILYETLINSLITILSIYHDKIASTNRLL